MTRHTILLQLVQLAAAGAPSGPPSEFRIFTSGAVETRNGAFLFDAKDAEMVMTAYREHAADIAIDYCHAMVGFSMGDPAEAGKAAGWCQLELRDGELWAVNVTWTPAATQRLADREYRYISPAFRTDGGRIVELLNVALTNIPATDNLDPLVAHRGGINDRKDPVMPTPLEKAQAKLSTLSLTDAQLEAFAETGRLPGDGPDARIVAAARTATNATEPDQVIGTLAALAQNREKAQTLSARVQELESKLGESAREALIAEGVRTGKLTAAHRDPATPQGRFIATLSNDSLRAFLEASQPVVRTDATALARPNAAPEALSAEPTAEEIQIGRMFGTDPAKLAQNRVDRARRAAAAG